MRPDAIIIRHSMPGAPHMLAGIMNSSIINGGDGAHEHPTQALLGPVYHEGKERTY